MVFGIGVNDMSKYLTKRWGEKIKNPTATDLHAALSELETPDSEHPDCWLGNEEGWTLSFHENGLAILENVETGEGPWHIKQVSRDAALNMGKMLLADDLDSLKSRQAWGEGYGST